MSNYDFKAIEQKWQQRWKNTGVFRAEKLSDKPKYYVLDMFPYPSGEGLHVGHPLGYIATDIVTRCKRLQGYNVLHPMGFDSFGLPAEQYAVQTGVHPATTTEQNCQRYREQLEKLGLHFDPDAWLKTSDPVYYRWTQWIFIRLFEHWYDTQTGKARPINELVALFEKEGNAKLDAATDQQETFSASAWKQMSPQQQNDVLMQYRLAYNASATVNWCPALGTVLANDEVKDGRSERGNYPVERRQMRQWMLRITAYADRLLSGLDDLDWSDALKAMQANWIGRSEGANIRYAVEGHPGAEIEVFTTRPDTLYGNTFMVLAPEHPLVERITSDSQQKEVETYVIQAQNRSERDRISDTRKTGIFTGGYALHPFTGDRLPIWISDYVLISYGTGAIMAVPAHDQRDWEFAHRFGLEIKEVIAGGDINEAAYDDKAGVVINSDFMNGMKASDAIPIAIDKLEEQGVGETRTSYRLRDVIWSRQRYWGEPTPIVYRDGVAHVEPDEQLPLELPHLEVFKPSEQGEPPLARAGDAWRYLEDGAERDLNTMPGAAGSSWYFFRYFDLENKQAFADPDRIRYWMPVDLYVGGAEHAVGHLLYARFWTKFLYDLDYSSVDEPFRKLINQGMIQGVSEKLLRLMRPTTTIYGKDADGAWQAHKIASDPVTVFISSTLAEDYPDKGEHEGEAWFSEIHIHIQYVKHYGLTSPSYLDREAIAEVGEWRPEYSEAVFVAEGGYYQSGYYHDFPHKGDERVYTRTEVEKMSKRYFNVINPDDVVGAHGTDTMRLFEMFLGPLEMSKPWDTQSINGVSKFLRRVYELFVGKEGQSLIEEVAPTPEEWKWLHKTIKKVEEDIERLSFNTAVAAFMDLVNNFLYKQKCHKRAILEPLAQILSPFAPHLCEELWECLGHSDSILLSSWPAWDESYLVEANVTYPIQINGKVRTKIEVPADADRKQVEEIVLAHERVQEWLKGTPPKKVIVVSGRIVNVVV